MGFAGILENNKKKKTIIKKKKKRPVSHDQICKDQNPSLKGHQIISYRNSC